MNEKYDLICVFVPNTGEERIDAVLGKIEKKLKAAGGEFEKVNKIGVRRVMTRMRKFKTIKDGNFVEIKFSAPRSVPKDIEGILRISEDVMKHILTKEIVLEAPKEVKAPEAAVEVNPEMLIGKPE